MILSGGTGSLRHKDVRDFYKWTSDNWELVFTLLDIGEEELYKLPGNVFPVNFTYQMLNQHQKIGHSTMIPVHISVSNDHIPNTLTDVNIVRYGNFERRKNGRNVLANDATSSKYHPAKVFLME